MKIFFASLLSLFLLVSAARAQDTLLVKKNYSTGVIMKVADVSSVINLTVERKLQFAAFFDKENNLLQAASANEESSKNVAALKDRLFAEFASLLSATELNVYSTKKKGSTYARPATAVTSSPVTSRP
ncbi:hypothetical protein [Mucilaginibacter sp.]|uniref:hypothetical protein n=1 Tax=Mucilaginibacter sp. TaxID=1882438 RepID=UPI0035BC0FAC